MSENNNSSRPSTPDSNESGRPTARPSHSSDVRPSFTNAQGRRDRPPPIVPAPYIAPMLRPSSFTAPPPAGQPLARSTTGSSSAPYNLSSVSQGLLGSRQLAGLPQYPPHIPAGQRRDIALIPASSMETPKDAAARLQAGLPLSARARQEQIDQGQLPVPIAVDSSVTTYDIPGAVRAQRRGRRESPSPARQGMQQGQQEADPRGTPVRNASSSAVHTPTGTPARNRVPGTTDELANPGLLGAGFPALPSRSSPDGGNGVRAAGKTWTSAKKTKSDEKKKDV